MKSRCMVNFVVVVAYCITGNLDIWEAGNLDVWAWGSVEIQEIWKSENPEHPWEKNIEGRKNKNKALKNSDMDQCPGENAALPLFSEPCQRGHPQSCQPVWCPTMDRRNYPRQRAWSRSEAPISVPEAGNLWGPEKEKWAEIGTGFFWINFLTSARIFQIFRAKAHQ